MLRTLVHLKTQVSSPFLLKGLPQILISLACSSVLLKRLSLLLTLFDISVQQVQLGFLHHRLWTLKGLCENNCSVMSFFSKSPFPLKSWIKSLLDRQLVSCDHCACNTSPHCFLHCLLAYTTFTSFYTLFVVLPGLTTSTTTAVLRTAVEQHKAIQE